MAILKKTLFPENLEKYSVLIQDTEPTSRYFKITELPDTFTGGKNAFLIQGSEFLVADTIVKIEIKDSQGNVIYHEPGEGVPEYYEGTSKVISVYVYPDTAFGPCTITILGELSEYIDANGITQPIPLQYRDTYNVRWQGVVNVNPFLQNTTKIRFYRRPKIDITEQVLPVFNRTVVTKTLTGNISGVPIQPTSGSDYRTYKGISLYELQMGGTEIFSQSMEGFTMSIDIDGNPYTPTITDVFTDKRAFVNIPYFVTSSVLPTYQSVTGFTNKPFTITYEDSETLSNSNVSSSFAVINITDLESFTGDPARIKVYASSKQDLGDYQLLEDIQLESSEILLEREFQNQLNVRTGIFSQPILDTFWVTESLDTTPNISIDNSLLMKSVRLEPQNDFSSSNGLFTFHYKNELQFNKNTEYQLDFTPLLAASSGFAGLEVYLSGSAFANTESNRFGKEVFLLDVNQTYGTFDKQQIIFKPDMDGSGQIVFMVNGGTWHLANISLRAAQESFFSPNETTLIADVPTKINNETFDFKFEIYDINNNYVPVTIEKTFTFTGGNDVRIRRDLEVSPAVNQFNFSTSSAFPSSILIDYVKTGLTGSVTFFSQAVDTTGLGITELDLNGSEYPGLLEIVDIDTVKLSIESFMGSLSGGKKVGAITYTASCEDINRYFTIYRVEQGAPSYLFYATADKNVFTFDPDDKNKSIISDDFIDIRLVKQNLPSIESTGLLIFSGSNTPNVLPPALTEIGSIGNATIYRIYVSESIDNPNPINNFYYELGQVTYDFDLLTVDGHFTSSISIDAVQKGDKAKALIVTSDANQFFYKMTDLSPTPTSQTITILVKRQNLGSLTNTISIQKTGSGPDLTYVGTSNGVDTYTVVAGKTTNYTYENGTTKYRFTAYDLNGIAYSDEITISPVISESQISVNLSNENVTLPALSNGFVASGSFVLTNGSVSVKVGNEDIVLDDENDGNQANNTFAITSLIGTNCIPVGGQGSNPTNANYGITSLTADSGSLDIVVRYKDGRGTLTNITKSVTYSKAKASKPNVLVSATPQAQSVLANSSGVQTGTLSNVTVSALEGGTNRFSSMTISSTSGFSTLPTVTGNSNTLVMTSAVLNSAEASVTLSVNYIDGEGTSGAQTIIIRATKVNVGQDGEDGAPAVVINISPASQITSVDITGSYSQPEPFTVNVTQGATIYSYDNSSPFANSTFRIEDVVNGTNNNNGTITPNKPTSISGLNVTFNVIYVTSTGNSITLPQSHRVSVVLDGQTGPGVVFTGVWTPNRPYQFSIGTGDGDGRRDVVLWSPTGAAPYENYYAAKRQHTSVVGNSIDGSPSQPAQTAWENLGSQDFFVAAKIGIFEESFVQNTLNIGTNNNGNISSANITLAGGTTNPYMSIGQTVQGYGNNGVFLGRDSDVAKFSLVNGTDSFLKWNGSSLEIKGSINFTNQSTIDLSGFNGYTTVTTNINTAQTTANNAANAASTAQTTADNAATAASNAQTTANNAATAASNAQSTATNAINTLQAVVDGNSTLTGTFINDNFIYSPNIAGQNGYFSDIFRVGFNGITLDGTNKSIYVGPGNYNNADTPFYFKSGSSNIFSLGNKLSFDGSTLTVAGTINANAGTFSGNITSTATISGGTISGGTLTGGSINIGNGKFVVGSDGTLSATGANIDGNITAQQGNIGGWNINSTGLTFNTQDGTRGVKLNSVRGALELFTSGSLTVDINSNTFLTNLTSVATLWPTASPTPFVPAGTLLGDGTPRYGSVHGDTLTLSAGRTYQFSFGFGALPTVTNNGDYMSVGFGLILSTDSTPTINNATYLLAGGGYKNGAGTLQLQSFTSVFLASTSATYYVRPYIVIFSAQETYDPFTQEYNFNYVNGSLNGDLYLYGNITPSIEKTEIVGGGIQVVKDTDTYFRVDRNADGSNINPFIYGVGSSVVFKGNVGSTNANDFRLEDFENIYLDSGGTTIDMRSSSNYLGIYNTVGARISGGYIQLEPTGTGNYAFIGNTLRNDNRITVGTTGPSDERLKTEIEDVTENAVDKINELKIKSYRWKSTDGKGNGRVGDGIGNKKIGVIAQEVLNTNLNHLVEQHHPNDDGDYYVDWGSLIGYSLKAIQELSKKIEELEAKISGSI